MPVIRAARPADLATIVEMLADDALGATREEHRDPLPSAYAEAFEAIAVDANNSVLVAEEDGRVVAVLQITVIPSLTYAGRPRGQIEGVRVRADRRGTGVGRALVEHAVEHAVARGCHVVQLTTDKRRPDALRFYESLGFAATHEGLKRLV